MGIFLRHSYNVKPPRWGSPADVQYAIKVNSEKIYDVDPNSIVLAMPLFWGLPLLDYSGKNNHGTNHGTTYKDGSLDFDGSNDYVNLGQRPSLQIMGAITVAAWLKLNSDYTTAQAVIADAHFLGAIANYVLTFGFTNNKYEFWNNASGSAIISTASISDNNWHYIVATRDGETNDWDLNIYIDGDLDNTVLGSLDNPDTGSDGYQAIGRFGGYPTGYKWNGLMDEVRISNITQTADQIALFHALPYGLYQPVSRPIWLMPAAATTLPPTTVAPTTPSPTTVSPTTTAPTTMAPTTTAPTTLPPTTPSPTTLPPTTLPPTTVAPTTLPPTTLAPTTLAPTTAAPTTLAPTTTAPTSLPPTTLVPTTVAPTLPPTTDIPEMICVKVCDSTITQEIICKLPININISCYAPITEEIIFHGNLC